MVAKKKSTTKLVKKVVKAKAKKSKKVDKLGQMDVAFVIDVTGSMGPYIQEAKERAAAIIKKIQADGDMDIRVALVAYRDHPPQDMSFVTLTHDFDTIDNFDKSLATLLAGGGGDHPEAVWDGVNDLMGLSWRDKSDRVAYLIGDAPPHKQCLCGITPEKLIEGLTKLKIELNAHSIAGEAETTEAFNLLVKATDGTISTGNTPKYTTALYTTSLGGHSGSIASARSFVSAYAATAGGYTTAADVTLTAAMNAGEAIGMSETEVKDTLKYLNKREM